MENYSYQKCPKCGKKSLKVSEWGEECKECKYRLYFDPSILASMRPVDLSSFFPQPTLEQTHGHTIFQWPDVNKMY